MDFFPWHFLFSLSYTHSLSLFHSFLRSALKFWFFCSDRRRFSSLQKRSFAVTGFFYVPLVIAALVFQLSSGIFIEIFLRLRFGFCVDEMSEDIANESLKTIKKINLPDIHNIRNEND